MKEKKQSKSIKKKLLRLLKYALLVLLGLLVVLSLLFQLPTVQSVVARRLANTLSEKTHTRVSLASLDVSVFNGIEANGIELIDSMGSPMMKVGHLQAKIGFLTLLSGRLHFRSVVLDTVDFRLIIHKQSDDYAFIKFINRLSSSTPYTKKNKKPFVLKIKRLSLNQAHFQLKDANVHNKYGPHSMDYEDLDVKNIVMRIHDFHITNDSLNFVVDKLSAREKSGFRLNKMKSHVIISGKAFYFTKFSAITNHSSLAFDYYMDAKGGWDSYSDFIDSVKLRVNLKPSVVDLSDVGYFAEVMFNMPDVIKIRQGSVDGPISRMTGKGLDIRYGSRTHFSGDFSIAGLPDFYSSGMKSKIVRFTTSTRDLRSFFLPDDSLRHIPLPDFLPENEKLSVKGNFDGRYDNFFTKFKITSGKGKAGLEALMETGSDKAMRLAVNVDANQFPLGRWLGDSTLIGNSTFNGQVRMDHIIDPHAPINIELNFSRLQLNHYYYQNLVFYGDWFADSLVTNLSVDDPHVKLGANGYVLMRNKPLFHLHADVAKADFRPLNLWTQKDFHLKTNADIRWKGFDPDTFLAHISMKHTRLQFGTDVYPIKKLEFEKLVDSSGANVIQIHSDILAMKLKGHYEITKAVNMFEKLVNHYFPAFKPATGEPFNLAQHIHLRLDLYRPKIIGEHFIRGLSISPGSWLTADFNFRQHRITADAYSKKLQYQGIDFKGNRLKIKTDSEKLSMQYQLAHLILKDSTENDKSVFGLDSIKLALGMRNDSLTMGLRWHNSDSSMMNSGDIAGVYVKKHGAEAMKIVRSRVVVNDSLWHLDNRNSIRRDSLGWHFNNFMVQGGQSQLAIEGHYPKLEDDSLIIAFRKWNLSNLDLLWRFLGFDIDGIINGNITFTRSGGRMARVANLYVGKLALNHVPLGTARVLSTWDDVNSSAFIKSQIIRKGNSGIRKVFALDGFYYPYRDTASLDLKINFNHLNLKCINSFFAEYVSHIKGVADGHLSLKGTPKDLTLTGFVNMKRTSLIVNYLNTRYSFEQKLLFKPDTIDFGRVMLYDTLGNQGVLTGKLFHHHFHDARLDLHVTSPRLLFFNTTRRINDVYYGQAIASGKVSITGPLNNILINIDATSEKGTSVILPLDYSTEIPDKDYIVFKTPPTDSSQLIPTETVLNLPAERKSQYAVNLNMAIRPNAKLKIYLPSNIGNLESVGSGALSLKTNSAGDLSLSGDYVVKKGEFNFSLANVVKKHFELVKGGRISWAGDPYKARVNIKGLYRVKANLGSLGVVLDTTTTFRNRVNVDCYVVMSKNLFNPDIRFEIKFPNLDPDLQRLVYSQLDTANQAVMNQQMISLLVLGTFNFSNPGNVTLGSASSSILSNQISGMLSTISKNFDVGFNYKPGDAISKEEFEVALSTQLFDDRLIINGNFGMSYDRKNRSASNLVGDVDIGYKLTKDGRWMLKAFNHSNVNSWYYYSNYDKVAPYTQGVGIAYQKEFNKLADLFRRKRKAKKQTRKSIQTNKKP